MYYNIAMDTSNEVLKKNSALNLPPLPLDVQSFKKIARTQFLYIDKTRVYCPIDQQSIDLFFSIQAQEIREISPGNLP